MWSWRWDGTGDERPHIRDESLWIVTGSVVSGFALTPTSIARSGGSRGLKNEEQNRSNR